MKRQRGRGRKPGNPSNRSFESNGPDVKIRGTASQIHEKYLQLARDASSAGDRVRAEALYQHAEHYFRIIQANQPPRREGEQGDGQGQGDGQNQPQGQDGQSAEGRDPMEVVTPEGGEMTPPAGEGEGGEEKSPRRRTRRSRRSRSESSEGSTEASAPATDDAQAALDNASASADAGEPKSDSESEAA